MKSALHNPLAGRDTKDDRRIMKQFIKSRPKRERAQKRSEDRKAKGKKREQLREKREAKNDARRWAVTEMDALLEEDELTDRDKRTLERLLKDEIGQLKKDLKRLQKSAIKLSLNSSMRKQRKAQ